MLKNCQIWLAASVIFLLCACSAPPELHEIDSSSPEKPINTPETALEIKRTYRK